MKFESFFRPKPKQDLEKQVTNVSENLNTDLVHESMQEHLGLLEVKDLKEKYQLRYNTYLAMLRAEKQGKELEGKDFNKAKVWINALNNLDNYIQKQANGEIKVLRGRQVPVLNEIRNALERGVTRGYVKLPTGVGKTVLFSQLIEALNVKTLIGVPSLPLVKQTSDRMEQYTTKSYGTYSSEGKDTTKEITTITYQSLIKAVKNDQIKSEDFPIFVLDEAHKALGIETTKAISAMEDSIQIGFTATPHYSTDHSVSKVLPEEIYSMELREAIEEGLVSRTKTIHAFTDVDLSSVPIVNGDYDSKELEKAVNKHGRNMAALELYKNKFSDQKAIVNCSGVQHAKDVADLFIKQGIKAAHIDGSMNEDQRNDILQKLATGELMVVTNAKLLLEGFDEPTVSVSLNLSPTLSIVNAEQRGGRALRLNDNDPEKWGYVVDFIDKNSKKKQVLFSEILGGDVIIPEKVDEKNNVITMGDEEREIKSRTPIDFSDLNIDGLKVVVDTKDIMEVTKEYQESREDDIPNKKEGWESAGSLVEILRFSHSSIKKTAESYRIDHPEWFEIQKNGTIRAEYYSPELVQKITEEDLIYQEKKPGWENSSSLSKIIFKNPETIKNYTEVYRDSHPEWFEIQRNGSVMAEHYSPELVSIISKELEDNYKLGWEGSNSLAKLLKADKVTIQKIAESYRIDHPEWFEIQRKRSLNIEKYSPELIEVIKKKLDVEDKKPGWECLNFLIKHKVIKGTYSLIKKTAESYRIDHPEWFEIQKNGNSKTENYSPELIKALKNKFSKKLPEWIGADRLSKDLKTHSYSIKKFTELYKSDHPEWFETRVRGNIGIEIYSPELVALIIKEFNVPGKKPGWENLNILNRNIIRGTSNKILEAINNYRINHPEWFEIQRSGTIKTEHYSPELIELLKKELGSK